MELTRNAVVLWLVAVIGTFGGIALVITAPMPLPFVGVLAIIVGLMSLMPALYFTLE